VLLAVLRSFPHWPCLESLRCGLIGLAFGIFYVVTGSIWLPIVAHVLLDVLQGAAIHEILRKRDDTLEPQLAWLPQGAGAG